MSLKHIVSKILKDNNMDEIPSGNINTIYKEMLQLTQTVKTALINVSVLTLPCSFILR